MNLENEALREDGWNAHRGCRLSMPNLETISPVIIEIRAFAPALKADIQPTVPPTRSRGRTRAVWFNPVGNSGPKRMPIIEIEIAAT